MLPETLRIDGRKPRILAIQDDGVMYYQIAEDGEVAADGDWRWRFLDGKWCETATSEWTTESEAEAAAYLAADLPPELFGKRPRIKRVGDTHQIVAVEGDTDYGLDGTVWVTSGSCGWPAGRKFATPAESYAACWDAAREACPNRETVADEPQGNPLSLAIAKLHEIVCTEPPDDGVVLLSNDGPCHPDPETGIATYDHEHFSPLGDALIELDGLLNRASQEFADLRRCLSTLVANYPQRKQMMPHIKRAMELLDKPLPAPPQEQPDAQA